jgi:two-component system response regulator PfeR
MKKAASILVIEDDFPLNQQVCELLTKQGFYTNAQYDGETGLTEASKGLYDLILLDAMLPNRDGYSLLNILRKTSQTPVIMVTAKGAEEERIRGLQNGADDYLPKPFNKTELLLRIEALLRRTHQYNQINTSTANSVIELDGLKLNKIPKTASVYGDEFELTNAQFSLLWALLSNQKETLDKPYLYQNALNKSYGVHDRSLDMHLSRIRRKLSETGWNGERLKTIHGKGYCLQ